VNLLARLLCLPPTKKSPEPTAVAYFEDGSSQSKFTNRLPHVNVLEFKCNSPLKEVRLDPEEALAQASME
jgi:hypothetical protein